MHKVEIIIGGKKYNVTTDENPTYVKKIENVLNEQINLIANSNKRFNDIDKLILSSFVVTDKYIKITDEISELKKEIYHEIQTLKEKNEETIKEKEEVLSKFDALNQERDNYKEKLSIKDNDREYLNSLIAKLQDKNNEADDQLLKSELLINELKNKNEELNEINENLMKERENFTKELSYMNNTKSSLNGRISKLQLKLNEKEQYITELEKNIKEVKKSNDNSLIKIDNLNEEINQLNLSLELKSKDISSLNSKITLMQQKLNEKDETVILRDKIVNDLKRSNEELKQKYESINEEKEKYLEELLMINNDKESLISKINQLQEKLNRKEAENFQNELEISKLKKENRDLVDLLEEETTV